MWMSMRGDVVVDGVVVAELREAAGVDRGAVVETGAGGTVRDDTDRDEVVEGACRAAPGAAVVVVGADVTVWPVKDVLALSGPAAPSGETLSGRMKAKESNAVSPPIHSSTSDGKGFQPASRPTTRRCVRNSRR